MEKREELQSECQRDWEIEKAELGVEAEIYRVIHRYSYLIDTAPDTADMEKLIELVTQSEELNWNNKYFIYGQINHIIFVNHVFETKRILLLKWKLLDRIYQECRQELNAELERIPLAERDTDMAVVIADQFLIEQHGPTKTSLDRCITLKHMKKKVLLINTAELSSEVGIVPFYNASGAKYMPEHLAYEKQYWHGEEISFFQCEQNMPDADTMKILLDTIRQLRPSIAVCIGGNSLFAGLLNELVPVLTIGTTSSGAMQTLADYQMVTESFVEAEKELVESAGRSPQHMIPGKFTFMLKEQTEWVTREQLGLPKDAFLLMVVGGRLGIEMRKEFLDMLEQIVSDDIELVVLGNYDGSAVSEEVYPNLKKHMHCMGIVWDILSRMEICDLYVNPIRKGGGTSVVEAMSKGKPAICTSFGDVYGIVDKDFSCEDYTEMADIIRRYVSDKEFYERQSKKAIELAEVYLDTETEFRRVVEVYLQNEQA